MANGMIMGDCLQNNSSQFVELRKYGLEQGDCVKKFIMLIIALTCIIFLAGCNNKSMDYIIENELSIMGIVNDTNENFILIKNEDGEYQVSLNVENKDSMTHFNIGDVVVYYDGYIAESYPMQINKVYAIILKMPADRTEND